MIRSHDSPIPLALGLLFAATVHLVAAPPASFLLGRGDRPPMPPDLRVENVVVPHDVLLLKQPNRISFDVFNRGTLPTPGTPWEDRIYLSRDDRLDSGDVLLLTRVHPGGLEPGRGYRAEVDALTLPANAEPPFYLLFQTDAGDAVDEGWMESNNVLARRFDPAEALPEPAVAIGKEDASRRVSVAWISYEDFRELVAPASETEQPAVQSVTEPVPAAPLEPDPTPPAAAPTLEEPRTPAEAGGTLAEVAAEVEPTAPPLPPVPEATVAPAPQPGPAAPAQPDLQQAQGDGDSATDAAPASRDEPARPTQTPRDESEATPTLRYPKRLDVQPGGTIVGEGIEIKTARPNFSAVARASTLPNNPEAELTFDHTGTVVSAVIVKSSGSDNVDAPILRSFYRWKASGKQIDELEGTLVIPIRVILGN